MRARRMKMLEIKALSGGYGQINVLWDIDLRVGDNEIVALVGSNGAGKSTLLRMISGMLQPTKGSISWKSDDIASMPSHRIVSLGIAHVPEGRHLFSGLTVKENLVIGSYHRKDSEIEADIQRMVEYFPRLGERMTQVAGRLSGGEQQMCAIARGLMAKPDLIMIDELSLGLAPKLVDDLLDRLDEIKGAGTSVLLVEQDVDAALRTAARGYVLETGRIVAEGKSTELLSDARVKEAYLGVG
jgi:branched-chain amino acid transport system ATP-binding protein